MSTVKYLQKKSNSNTNSAKYLIDCGKITTKDPTTEDWLHIEKQLKPTNFDDKNKVLLGVLKKKRRVVIKIGGSETLEKEYKLSEAVKSEGIINFICFFTCNDNYKDHPSIARNHMCNGPGLEMKCLVMPYYEIGNIREFKFRDHSNGLNILKSLLKLVFLYMVDAYNKIGFIHNDTHAQNILLVKTTRKEILDIPLFGYRPMIMDLENALIAQDKSRDRHFVYMDFGRLIADLHYNSELYLDGSPNIMMFLENIKHDFEQAKPELFKLIDRLTFKEKPIMNLIYNPNLF